MNIAETPTYGIGWAYAGVVDQLDSEGIATEFFHVVIPAWPGRSHYVYMNRDGSVGHFEVPRNRRSVVLGYLRTPLWFAALIVGLPGVVDFARWGAWLAVGAVLAMIAALSTFVAGKLEPAEREHRAMLRRVAGIGAPPELIPPEMLAATREALAEVWFHQTDTDWRDAIHRGDAHETLVVLAEYHRDAQLAIRARTNLIDAEGN